MPYHLEAPCWMKIIVPEGAERALRILQITFSTFPSPSNTSAIVEPYNAILCASALLEHSSVSLVFDNEKLYDVCCKGFGIRHPSFADTNRLIAQAVSSVANSFSQSGGQINTDMSDFHSNLVPYRRLHFMLPSYAPISGTSMDRESHSTSQITLAALSKDNFLAKVDPRSGKYLAVCLLYRGEVGPNDAELAVKSARQSRLLEFVDWVPTGVRIGEALSIANEGTGNRPRY